MTIISYWPVIREVVHGRIAYYSSPDRVDRCNLLGHRILTAAGIKPLHFTSLFIISITLIILALLSPSQWYNSDPGS